MLRAVAFGGFVAMITLFGGVTVTTTNAQAYECRNGRSTDPNCYRGPRGVYVCGPCYGSGRRYRRSEYGCDRRGRSTDPDCYRGPQGVYVCGPCYD